MGHRLGAVQKADRGSEGGIYDVEGQFFHPIDRALTLLLLDRENFGSMIQSGWRVDGLVALLVALLVTSLRQGSKKFSCLGAGGLSGSGDCGSTCSSVGAVGLALQSTPLQLPPWRVLSQLRPYSRS